MKILKALSIALVAVFAMTAILASAAQAAKTPTNLTRTDKATTVILTAEQDPVGAGEEIEQVFTVNTGKVKCKSVKIDAKTVTLPTTTVRIHPIYENCTAFGLAATVTTTGCDFEFHLTEHESAADPILAQTTVVCEAGKQITVTPKVGSNCVTTVGSQTLGDVQFTNTVESSGNKKDDLTLESSLEGIKYKETGTNCVKNGVESTNGKYVGKVTIKGFVDNEGVEGAQTDIDIG